MNKKLNFFLAIHIEMLHNFNFIHLLVKTGGGFGVVTGFVVITTFGLGVVFKGGTGPGFFVVGGFGVGGFDVTRAGATVFGGEGVVGVVVTVVVAVVGDVGGQGAGHCAGHGCGIGQFGGITQGTHGGRGGEIGLLVAIVPLFPRIQAGHDPGFGMCTP